MKTFIAWLIGLGLAVALGILSFKHYHELKNQHAYDNALARLQRDTARQTAALTHATPETYANEINAFLQHYYAGLDQLATTYPGALNIEREVHQTAEIETELAEAQRIARKERIELTLQWYKAMEAGQYKPLYTAVNNGFRFDIIDIKPHPDKANDSIRVTYAHWNAFGPVAYKSIKATMQNANVDKAKKPDEIAQLVGRDQPPTLQIEPQRWVREFVPNVEIGYYEFPKFPHDTSGVQFEFEFSQQTPANQPVIAHLQFPEIPLTDAWKLRPGQNWEGQEQLVDEAEMRATAEQLQKNRTPIVPQ